MLKKENRLNKDRDYLRIFKSVRPGHTEHMAFRAAKRFANHQGVPGGQATAKKYPTPHTQSSDQATQTYHLPSRFGFVVSNKIDKRASRRNGLKRRIRSVIEIELANLEKGYDVVIQVKKPFNFPYDFKEIECEVMHGLRGARILK